MFFVPPGFAVSSLFILQKYNPITFETPHIELLEPPLLKKLYENVNELSSGISNIKSLDLL